MQDCKLIQSNGVISIHITCAVLRLILSRVPVVLVLRIFLQQRAVEVEQMPFRKLFARRGN